MKFRWLHDRGSAQVASPNPSSYADCALQACEISVDLDRQNCRSIPEKTRAIERFFQQRRGD
jgi:hypothetical protein